MILVPVWELPSLYNGHAGSEDTCNKRAILPIDRSAVAIAGWFNALSRVGEVMSSKDLDLVGLCGCAQVAMRGLERQLCRLKDRSTREEQAQLETLGEKVRCPSQW